MKTLLYSFIFFFFAQYSFAQEIDENGRTVQDRAKQITNLQAPAPMLQQSQTDKNSQEVVVSFAFPATIAGGEMRLFHPQIDKELEVYQLSTTTGQVRIPIGSLVSGFGVVGLYNGGKLLSSLRLKYE